MLTSAGDDSRDGEKGRMALPLVVVISGKTATMRRGFCSRMALMVVRPVRGTTRLGGARARTTARNRDTCCTLRVSGYETTKMGSKMAAR